MGFSGINKVSGDHDHVRGGFFDDVDEIFLIFAKIVVVKIGNLGYDKMVKALRKIGGRD